MPLLLNLINGLKYDVAYMITRTRGYSAVRTYFLNRAEAGQALAGSLFKYARRTDVLVLALPRGGVPVGWAVAQHLHAPLEVFLVRKLGVPGHEELAMGAIASGGACALNQQVIDELGIPPDVIAAAIAREKPELVRREHLFRKGRPFPSVRDRTLILVDDGVATGSTVKSAILALREKVPRRIVVAAPVIAAATCLELSMQADEVVAILTPQEFLSVGQWYADFSQISDAEVTEILSQAIS